ncbi:MAG: tetratricopeptide repeat protein [Deltaproteobacteria bacterium]|nr:tetratricopeptide repeat protein [Deltaproteobacteria bacterium]
MDMLRPALVALYLLLGCASHPLQREAAALNSRGARLLSEGQLADAEASLRLAVEYNPRYAEPYNNLGLVLLARAEPGLAEPFLLRAVRLNPDFAEAWNNLGVARLRALPRDAPLEAQEPAVEAFREALSINPGLLDARINLTRRLLARRDPEALEQARRADQLSEGRDEASLTALLRAEAALQASLTDEALGAVARVLEREPGSPEARLLGARVALARGRPGEALAALDGLTEGPLAQDARAWRALTLLAVDDVAGARVALGALGPDGAGHPVARYVREALASRP